MRIPRFAFAVCIVVAACGGTSGGEPATTVPAALGELSYGYEPGSTYTYEVTSNQSLTLDGSVAGDLPAEDAPIPENGDVTTTQEGTVLYEVADGEEEGTVELTITNSMETVDVSGTIDGEDLGKDIPPEMRMAEGEHPPVTVVMDLQGNVVEAAPGETGLEGLASPLASLEGLIPGDPLRGPLGPTFPDTELTVGEEWSNEQTLELLGEEIGYTTVNQIAGVEDSLVVIDSTTTVSAFDISLTDFLAELFGAAAGSDPGADEILDQLEFTVSGDPADLATTNRFDPEQGLITASESEGTVAATIVVRLPNESGTEIVGFDADASVESRYEVTLVEPGETPVSTTAGS
jgi:hypothetical protein